MPALKFAINVTLDGCYDHRAADPFEGVHRHATEIISSADALLFGRVTYQMMEEAWRPAGETVGRPAWMEPFARSISAAKKYVVSRTLASVDWNAELVRDDLEATVRALKQQPGKHIFVGGVQLAFSLTELGLIDEYELMVHPKIIGHGPTLFAGLSKHLTLEQVGEVDLGSGVIARRYVPRR